MGPVARELLGEPNKALSSAHELRWGSHGSFSVDLRKGTWFDHETQQGGGVFDLLRSRGIADKHDAFVWMEDRGIKQRSPQPNGKGNGAHGLGIIVAVYPYHDEAGITLFEVLRFDPKNFRQRRPDGKGGHIWGIKGVRLVPFRLPELTEAIALERVVFICYAPDTEVLTPQGWVPFPELRDGQAVAQWDKGTGAISFAVPKARQCLDFDGELINFKADWCNLLVTPDHRQPIFVDWDENARVIPASNVRYGHWLPIAGLKENSSQRLSADQARLLVAWLADGVWEPRGLKLSWTFKKQRKFDRLRNLLKALAIPWTQHVYESSLGWATIKIDKTDFENAVGIAASNDKRWPWDALDWPLSTRHAALEEVAYWDGDHIGKVGRRLFTAELQTADVVCAVAACSGWYANMRTDKRRGHTNYIVNLAPKDRKQLARTPTRVAYHGPVYCCTVDTGFIVVRRNGKVAISGNCEGEKDVLNLERLGVPATCNPMGAGCWREDYNRYFIGADVIVVADNDPQTIDKKTGKPQFHPDGRPKRAGQDHAQHVCAQLRGVASRVRYLELKAVWAACPVKGDISNWIEAGGTVEQLNAIADALPDWVPEAPAADTVPWQCPFPIDPATIPQRPWLIKNLLLRRQVTLLVAPPGSGKSLLTLQIGILCAATERRKWCGWEPCASLRVLIINSEEDLDEQKRRLWAAAAIMGIPQSELGGLAIAVEPETIVIGKTDSKTKTVTREPMLEKIKQTVVDGRFDVIVVDPFAETFVGDENSNSEVKWAGVLWREVARSCNCAVLLVHHSKKYAGQMAGDMDAARGGGSLVGIARIVCTLFSVTDQDSDDLNLEAEVAERGLKDVNEMKSRLLRFDDAKANLSLVVKSPLSRCFYKETKRIENGVNGHDGDDIGVLIEFIPKMKIDQVLQDCAQANLILDDIQAGVIDEDGNPIGEPFGATPKRGPKPKNWAGIVVQRHANCSPEDAANILDVWIKNGVLERFQSDKVKTRKGGLSECLRVIARPGATT
jgi:hypothetical protein